MLGFFSTKTQVVTGLRPFASPRLHYKCDKSCVCGSSEKVISVSVDSKSFKGSPHTLAAQNTIFFFSFFFFFMPRKAVFCWLCLERSERWRIPVRYTISNTIFVDSSVKKIIPFILSKLNHSKIHTRSIREFFYRKTHDFSVYFWGFNHFYFAHDLFKILRKYCIFVI